MQPRNQVAAENGKPKQLQELKDRIATENRRSKRFQQPRHHKDAEIRKPLKVLRKRIKTKGIPKYAAKSKKAA